MRVDNLNTNKLGFGWNCSTHKLFSEKIAANVNNSLSPKMQIDIEFLKESILEPDLMRKFDKVKGAIHGHFADIDNLSPDPPDAFHMLLRCTKKALEANQNAQTNEREFYKRDRYLAHALHYLQDMLNPFHVVFNVIPKDHPERQAHKRFERISESRQNRIIKETILSEKDSEISFFDKVLPDAMNKAKELWGKIQDSDLTPSNDSAFISAMADASLENTYRATNAYLQRIAQKFNNHCHKEEVPCLNKAA